jgi:hypothetical protein
MVLGWKSGRSRSFVLRLFGVASLSVAGFGAVACGPDADDGSKDPCPPPEGERGTGECKRYHAALCEWVETCGSISKCECVDQASAITCISEAQATSCADTIESASCSAPPVGCDLSDLADTSVAQAACEQYIAAVCAHDVACGTSDPMTCIADARSMVNCALAVGVKPSFDQCIPDIEALGCTARDIPESCDGALLLTL